MDEKLRKQIDETAKLAREVIFGSSKSSANLEETLEQAGIDVRFFTGKKYDGFLEWNADKNQPVISINAETEIGRQRFSMAHELAHLMIDWHWFPNSENSQFRESKVLNVTKYRERSNPDTPQSVKEHEDMMDEFAAGFLITDDEVLNYIATEKPASINQAISGLVKTFTVSWEAASRRLKHFLDGWMKENGKNGSED